MPDLGRAREEGSRLRGRGVPQGGQEVRSDLKGRYAALWVLGAALGWFEGAVVVYLRAFFHPAGFRFPLVPIPAALLRVEVAREAASLAILVSAAWLSGRRRMERFGAFLFLFGVWDLVYYGALKLVLGWPARLSDWDVLFLIPAVWTAPVWAPMAVAVVLAAAGSFLYLDGARTRSYRVSEWAVEAAAGALVVASFLANAGTVARGGTPSSFPAGLLGAGLGLGIAAFARAETRFRRPGRAARR